jgi:uncharacterized membrane protein
VNPELIPFSITLIVVGVIFSLLPRVTRPDLFFSVTVSRTFRHTETASRIVRRFQLAVLVATIAAVTLILSEGFLRSPVPPLLVLPGQILAVTAAFVLARRAVLPFAAPPEPTREAELQKWPRVIPGGILAAVGPLILASASVAAIIVWPEGLPVRLPVHFGLWGPDRWLEASAAGLARYYLLIGSVLVLLFFTMLGLSRAVGRAAATGETGAAEIRFRRVTIWMLLVISYFLAIQPWIALFVPDSSIGAPLLTALGLVMTVAIIVCIVFLIRMGQGGHRAVVEATNGGEAAPQGDHRPDSTWKLGLFYFNPEDPAIFVEKRFGIGYTLNFGNRWTWVALLILVPLLAAVIRTIG